MRKPRPITLQPIARMLNITIAMCGSTGAIDCDVAPRLSVTSNDDRLPRPNMTRFIARMKVKNETML